MKEYRIRYVVPTASGGSDVHAIICVHLEKWKGKIRAAGYPIVGIDQRTRTDDRRIPAGYGWIEQEG